ncbi:hypothetical protein [Microbacterium sp. CFBP9034]|uniref:hypothetical protein n=1 Tax=Microbacterium sp. CFBP9034 TaxID=3096540 RepID=UPI002A6A0014|nr:hypothetical protein [Microbacterium sp. CFBP9034]MDY0910325.1 hypothetical protein [Microbacterium sp. CFBP9034]
MTATPISIPYDPDRWIHVPLDYLATSWSDAGEWSRWIADEATRGRADAEEIAPLVHDQAMATALFPAEHVSARFWHYPVDGFPAGFVDIYVEARDDDGTPAAELLPEPGMTMVEPVIEPVPSDVFRDAVRRLTLTAILPEADADPVLLPKAEWIGAGDGWVGYAVSGDHDVARLNDRLADTDALFRTLDPRRVS